MRWHWTHLEKWQLHKLFSKQVTWQRQHKVLLHQTDWTKYIQLTNRAPQLEVLLMILLLVLSTQGKLWKTSGGFTVSRTKYKGRETKGDHSIRLETTVRNRQNANVSQVTGRHFGPTVLSTERQPVCWPLPPCPWDWSVVTKRGRLGTAHCNNLSPKRAPKMHMISGNPTQISFGECLWQKTELLLHLAPAAPKTWSQSGTILRNTCSLMPVCGRFSRQFPVSLGTFQSSYFHSQDSTVLFKQLRPKYGVLPLRWFFKTLLVAEISMNAKL